MSWTQPAFEAVARLVGARTGLKFAHREESVELGIRQAMARAGVSDAAGYLNLLAENNRILDDLVSDLTVGETYFFREPDQFQRIRRELLPDIRARRGAEHLVRVWSAGCASGEEAISLAIVLEQEGLGERFHVLATDISEKALATARRGVYRDWSLRGENRTEALPYLTAGRGGSYQVVDAIRRRVSYAPLNLALDVYPSFTNGTWGLDLILCRNVLIYFDQDTVVSVARRLYHSLSESGWLMTGSADPPLWDYAPFEVAATQQGIAYRRRPAVPRQTASSEHKGPDKSENRNWAEESGETETDNRPVSPVLPDASSLSVGFLSSVGSPGADPLQRVRALANLEPVKGLAECDRLLIDAPFSTELNYLRAMLLLDLGREVQALQAMRRVIYLDRSLAIAHFTLASMLRRNGDLGGARRAYRNARNLSAGLAADAVLPLGEGELAGRLAELACAELLSLEVEP